AAEAAPPRADSGILTSRFGRQAQHDVEPRGQFGGARARDRREVHCDSGALLRVLNTLVDAVLRISLLSLDIALRRPLLASLELQGEVDVRRPTGIGHRLDGAKIVFTRRAGENASETLEVFVAITVPVATAVKTDAFVVY